MFDDRRTRIEAIGLMAPFRFEGASASRCDPATSNVGGPTKMRDGRALVSVFIFAKQTSANDEEIGPAE
ncbi:MAG: hypothetical protein AB7P00_41360, partial [Sandaracinaceae bacterium]